MSRLDQHVRWVQSKMAFNTLLWAWAWAGIILGVCVAIAVLLDRIVQVHLPRQAIWFWSALGAAVAGGAIYAIIRRPTLRQAAVEIDSRLALKEKFSTALYVRGSKDPFAAAAVRDAEKTADQVSLHKRFPVQYPRAGLGTLGMVVAVLLIMWLFPTFDLFGVKASQQAKLEQRHAQQAQAEIQIRKAMVAIEAAPQSVQADEQIRLASKELPDLLHHAGSDPVRAEKRAEETLKQIDAIKQKIQDEKKFAEAQKEFESLKNISQPSPDETGPVADAQRALSEGKLDDAVKDLKKAVDNFDKMDKSQQEKAAQQMQNMAQQLAKQANNPQTQQQIQKQLQQAGVSQQQAQQMQQLMQQAANGNQQAAQQLQQAANQAIQQANQQAGLSQKQQQQIAQQIQQAVQKGQQQANGQANAQGMQQAAQSLAQAMKQASQGSKQQANGGKQQGQGAGGSQMAQSAQAMKQQLQQLQAQASGAAGVAAGQGGQAGKFGNNGGGQAQAGNNGQFGQGAGQFNQGQPQPGQQGGMGGPGIAAMGRRPDPTEAPFGVKQELSDSQTNENGKILASSFVKAPAQKGASKMSLSKVAEAEMKEATDEVDQERIPRGAWKAVKGYFDTLKSDQNQSGK